MGPARAHRAGQGARRSPVSRTSSSRSQQIMLDIDREAARQRGIEMSTVTQALNNAFGQRQVSTIYNSMNQYRVVMEVAPRYAQGPEALDEVYVVTPEGRVPLSAISKYTRSSANDRVSRNDQFASTSIGFELAPGVSLTQAKTAVDRAVSRLTLPTSIQGRLQGNASLFERMQGNQPVADPRNAADRLHRAGCAVRELPAPADDPVDAAFGGRRRAARVAAPEDPVQPCRAAGRLPADRRRDEERDPDDRRRAADRTGAPGHADAGDPRGVPAAAAADSDDDHGRTARGAAA